MLLKKTSVSRTNLDMDGCYSLVSLLLDLDMVHPREGAPHTPVPELGYPHHKRRYMLANFATAPNSHSLTRHTEKREENVHKFR